MKIKIYQSLNPTKKEIKTLLKMARGRIDSAKILEESGQYRDAISRSYYAFLDSARAALLLKGKFTKTHSGALTLFEREFGRTKLIPNQFIKFYRKILKDRMEADYKFLREFSKEETKEAIKMAEKFVSFIEKNLIPK